MKTKVIGRGVLSLTLLVVPFLAGAAGCDDRAEAQAQGDAQSTGDSLVKFQGGIGVLPVASGVGQADTADTVNRNIVRGVQPAGQIWVISALTADVKTDGHIQVNGRGLLLGGGNLIGFNGNASVFATLTCEAMAPFTELSTNAAGVALDAGGNFRIDDVLVPAPSGSCDSPVLLIRQVATGGPWFAAGIPVLD